MLFSGIDPPCLQGYPVPQITVGGLQCSGLYTKCAYVHLDSAHPTTLTFVLVPVLAITNNLKVFKTYTLALVP